MNTQEKLNNLKNIHRITQNIVVMLSEKEVSRQMFPIVDEAVSYMTGMGASLEAQIKAIESVTPLEVVPNEPAKEPA